jgi:hypothetical protein
MTTYECTLCTYETDSEEFWNEHWLAECNPEHPYWQSPPREGECMSEMEKMSGPELIDRAAWAYAAANDSTFAACRAELVKRLAELAELDALRAERTLGDRLCLQTVNIFGFTMRDVCSGRKSDHDLNIHGIAECNAVPSLRKGCTAHEPLFIPTLVESHRSARRVGEPPLIHDISAIAGRRSYEELERENAILRQCVFNLCDVYHADECAAREIE